MKKVLSLLLTVVMVATLFAVVTVTATAVENPTVSFSDVTAEVGGTFTVDLTLNNNPGIAMIGGACSVDSDQITLDSVKNNPAMISDFTHGTRDAWVNATNVTANGVLATYTFKVSDDAQVGEYKLTFNVNDCLNESRQPVELKGVEATVTVVAAKPTPDYSPLEDFVYEAKTGKKVNTITIYQYQGTAKEIIIAPHYTIDGKVYDVVTVGVKDPEQDYFVDDETVRKAVTTLSLPETVTSFGAGTIYEFPALEKIVVLNNAMVFGADSLPASEVSSNAVIYGYTSSTAQTHATSETIDFKALDTKFAPATAGDAPTGIAAANLTLTDKISVNFMVRRVDFNDGAYKNPRIKYEMNGDEGVIETVKKTSFDNVPVFQFVLPKFAPQYMTDSISAELYADFEGQETLCGKVTYSVKQYCDDKLAATASKTPFGTLLVDMLNFGAEAQVATGHKTSTPANANLGTKAAWATSGRSFTSVLDITGTVGAVEIKGAALNLAESIGINFYVDAASYTGVTFEVTNMATGKTYKYTDADLQDAYGMKKLVFGKLSPAQMGNSIKIVAVDGSGSPLSQQVVYSVESYAAEKENVAENNLGNLVKAMIKYGDASKAYVESLNK